MNAPDPKANTTTEAYLAYKAGYLEESELKPSLYEPYLHFDAWLAYWAGLTSDYPVTISKKNLFDINSLSATGVTISNGVASGTAQAFNAAFGTASGGTVLSLDEGQYTISIKGYTDGNQATEATSGLGFRIGYSDGTYSSFVYWQNNDLSPVAKTITTESGKTPNSLTISFGAKGQNIWHLSEIQLEKGSSATSYEPYSTPEMLTDEEALVAYLSGVTDTYPEEIKDPYDVRIVGYLKHLASVRWPEPDYPVNNEEFYLSTMEPTHTSNSEPSADIELDTADGKIISVEAYGDTKQQTYTGKNLLNINAERSNQNTTDVINGQSITVTTTASTGTAATKIDFSYEANREITVSFDATALQYDATTGSIVTLRTIGGSDTLELVNLDTTLNKTVHYSATVTPDNATRALWLYLKNVGAAGVVSYRFDNIQIEYGSAETSFEPYVGGVPAPNPNYPQNVNVVTGRQQINVSGKNLLDTEYSKVKSVPGNTSSGRTWNDTEKTMEYNGITYKFNEDGTITVSGSTGSSPSFLLLNGPIENLQEGSDYYMSGCPAGGNAASYSLRLYTTASTYTPETGNGLAFTYVEQPFIRINISANIVADDLVFKPMIVNSSDAGDEFVPFQGYESYEINLGKNLFDGVLELGIINGNTGENAPNANYVRAKNYIPVKELTNYAVSSTNGDIASFNIYEYKADFTYNLTANRVVQKGRFWQTMAGTKYIRFRPAYQSTDTTMKFQIELGSTVTEYAPYFEPIELCKIGDYQDYIYKNGDDWYIHKAINKVILDGTETWTATGGGNGYRIEQSEIILTPAGDLAPILSNNFSVDTYSHIYNARTDYGIANHNNNHWIVLRDKNWTSASDVTTWLSSHNTSVYYALATATDTQITDSTLIGQLDALADADTYDGKTYIKIVANDPNLPALLKVEAYKY